jgi:hypothetical protein
MIDAERLESASSKLLALSRWINESPSYQGLDQETLLWRRVSKASIEANEALDALAGALGENPRKGVTNTMELVDYELLDTATAALGALAARWGNSNAEGHDPLLALVKHIEKVYDRAGRP